MLTRRDFVTASAGCALSNGASGLNRERLYEILIKNGDVRDPVVDSQRNAVTARQRIVSRLTICRGKR